MRRLWDAGFQKTAKQSILKVVGAGGHILDNYCRIDLEIDLRGERIAEPHAMVLATGLEATSESTGASSSSGEAIPKNASDKTELDETRRAEDCAAKVLPEVAMRTENEQRRHEVHHLPMRL